MHLLLYSGWAILLVAWETVVQTIYFACVFKNEFEYFANTVCHIGPIYCRFLFWFETILCKSL